LINYFKSYSSLGDDRFFCVTLYEILCLSVGMYYLNKWRQLDPIVDL